MKKLFIVFTFSVYPFCMSMEKQKPRFDPQATNHFKNMLDNVHRTHNLCVDCQIEERIRIAIENGANPNIVSSKTGESAFNIAIKRKDTQFLIFLIAHGLNPNARDSNGSPLLFKTLSKIKFLKILIAAGADPNGIDVFGFTSLIKACSDHQSYQLNCVDLLMESRVNVFAQDAGGNTALHGAVSWGSLVLIRRFFQSRDNDIPCGHILKCIKNENGRTPLDMARDRGDAGVLALMQYPRKIKLV